MTDIMLTNAAIMVEYKLVSKEVVTNAAIMVEYKQAIVHERLTNAAIMVEYKPAVGKVMTYAVAMPGYTGADRGCPIPGDRAAVIFNSDEPTETFPGIIWVEENP
jgi:uncharacterized membrane protein